MAEEGFRADAVDINIIAVNGQFISVYRKYTIEIAAININNMTKFFNIPFIVTDIKYYKTILNYL